MTMPNNQHLRWVGRCSFSFCQLFLFLCLDTSLDNSLASNLASNLGRSLDSILGSTLGRGSLNNSCSFLCCRSLFHGHGFGFLDHSLLSLLAEYQLRGEAGL